MNVITTFLLSNETAQTLISDILPGVTKESNIQALELGLDTIFGSFLKDSERSVEVEKRADLTILDNDIMTISEGQILDTKVS